jgi:multiple sugar transport system ATP-binding protein
MAAVTFDQVTKRFGDDTIAVSDLTLSVNEGEFLILVGPSGCGKTTALRMVAGLEEVTSGEIRIGEKVVNDLAPTQRDIAMVFQNYALYPHMSVYDNIAFPLRQQKVKKSDVRLRVEETGRLLSISELLQRKPRELSGGQSQRVAIGRALVRRPQVFLMDEPLSNLDAKLRVQMRAELLSLHQSVGITTIYVTHDQTEAMTLGDRVVVMNKGVVQQVDAPDRLYRHPTNAFVAGFIGSPAMNFLRGDLSEEAVQLGSHRITLPETVKRALKGRTGSVVVGLRPEDFLLANGNGEEATLPAEVQITEQLGPEVLLHFRADGIEIAAGEAAAAAEDEVAAAPIADALIARVDSGFHGTRGERVQLRINREHMQLFDPASGESLLRA